MKLEDAVADKDDIICLADRGDMDGADMHSKARVLGEEEFDIVGQFVKPITIDSPLLNPEFIEDWLHDDLVPLDKGPPVFEAVVEEDQRLPSG